VESARIGAGLPPRGGDGEMTPLGLNQTQQAGLARAQSELADEQRRRVDSEIKNLEAQVDELYARGALHVDRGREIDAKIPLYGAQRGLATAQSRRLLSIVRQLEDNPAIAKLAATGNVSPEQALLWYVQYSRPAYASHKIIGAIRDVLPAATGAAILRGVGKGFRAPPAGAPSGTGVFAPRGTSAGGLNYGRVWHTP